MPRLDRRQFSAALLVLPVFVRSGPALAASAQNYHTRAIRHADPVPVIGIGTARNYSDPVGEEQLAPLRASLARFAELGGRLIDTAPSYGRAEEVLGKLLGELGIRDKLYLATKVGADSPEEGKAQIEQSFARLGTDYIDLISVHNLRDVANQLAILRDMRNAGRIGAVGITTSFDRQYEDFEAVMRREQIDAIQVDYAIDNRNAAERILPLAEEKGIPAMINLPFGRERLFSATNGKPLPDWAGEIGAESWAQVFLKYILSHPSRPIAIPGTARVRYVDDNLGAARGPLPDQALRERMERYIDAL